jgi:hypothetical protein
MASIVVERTLSAPTSAVWEITKDFGNVGWIPGAGDGARLEGSGVGMARIMQKPEGGEIRETLVALDEAGQSITYTIGEGIPFPVSSYRATMTITDDGGKGHLAWSCEFEPKGASAEDAGKAIEGMYQVMLGWIDDFLKA